MNQILSVEMPRENNKKANRISSRGKKASIKSVIVFFCIILLIFGFVMIGLGVMSKLNETPNEQAQEISKPRIDISQNATKSELEVEISSVNEISKIEYRWNNEEMKEELGNGTGSKTLNIEIPSGENTFEIKVTDVEGITNEYKNVYSGSDFATPKVSLSFEETTNSLKIICNEEKNISYISYYYDSEQEQRQDINNTSAEINIPIKQGEHDLTVKVEYEDGTLSKPISNKVYFPVVEKVQLSEDGNSFVIRASDAMKINKVKMNFNGTETIEEVNSENYNKTLQLQDGENRLILTVYSYYGKDENNPNGVSITTKTRWIKNN